MPATADADFITLLVLVMLSEVPPAPSGGNKNHSVKQPVVCFFQPFNSRFSWSSSNFARLALS
jgi:hypothetical protein